MEKNVPANDEAAGVAAKDLSELAGRIGPRPTGSAGNREAAAYIKRRFEECGWQIETQEFEALDWKPGRHRLAAGGTSVGAQINPYAPGCSLKAPAVLFRSADELEAAPPLHERIAVLDGEFVSGQIMPKNFVFYNPEEHTRLNRLLEEKAPAAVIAVAQSGQNQTGEGAPDGIGSGGPKGTEDAVPEGPPLFADGDMKIPSLTVPFRERKKLLEGLRGDVELRIESAAEVTTAENVIARLNPGARSKLVVVAHFDTWFDTPGAMDNAVGAAVLLGLSTVFTGEVVKRIDSELEVELFANNGEDYYNSGGSLLYLERSMDAGRTVLAINIDGIGYRGRDTGLSFYGDLNGPGPGQSKGQGPDRSPGLLELVRKARRPYPYIVDMDPWPEGDHSMFAMQDIPALALTSLGIHDLMHVYHHTPADRLENIDTARVAEAVQFIAAIIESIQASHVRIF